MGRIHAKTSQKPSGAIEVLVDEKLYPREVSLAAAYRFLDRWYVRAERVPPERLKFTFKARPSVAGDSTAAVEDAFYDELLQQFMRHRVAEATAGLREILVRTALGAAEGSAGPAEASGESDSSYLDDPLGIAVPWEEKYGSAQADCGCEEDASVPVKKPGKPPRK